MDTDKHRIKLTTKTRKTRNRNFNHRDNGESREEFNHRLTQIDTDKKVTTEDTENTEKNNRGYTQVDADDRQENKRKIGISNESDLYRDLDVTGKRLQRYSSKTVFNSCKGLLKVPV